MRPSRFLVASAVLFVVALVWNGFWQLVVLREANQAIKALRRTQEGGMIWLSLLLTAGVVCLFVAGYGRFARNHTVAEGVAFGVWFALGTGLLVDLNQYLLYPIPGYLAALWFLGGLIEFSMYGAIASRLVASGRVRGEAAI